ncbi:MAG: hypothetical protein KF768_09170 [Phycisphaeraceae bacterium]|nr:hypothetical protein [Phycisphaeraceae bacterium]
MRRPHTLARALSLAAAVALATLLVTPDPAHAQARPGQRTAEPLRPPVPPVDREAKANYWGALAVILGIALLCAANLIPSKRGHQD